MEIDNDNTKCPKCESDQKARNVVNRELYICLQCGYNWTEKTKEGTFWRDDKAFSKGNYFGG
jgi:transposase-like protein